jgi:hypothetical protein
MQLHHSGVDVLSKLMSANFVGEVRNASSGEPTQQLTHGQRRPLGRRQLANQSATDSTRIEIKLIKKERIRVDDLNVVRFDRSGGKVLHVERHHDLGPARPLAIAVTMTAVSTDLPGSGIWCRTWLFAL